MSFCHLHLHTQYSLNDSTITPKKLAKKMKALGMKKVAVTDHGVMFNIPQLYKELKYEGIELIIGMETYIAPRSNILKEAKIDNANYHLVLLCENEVGYHNLIRIASDAAINGYYYRARTDKNHLKERSEGLIALSACLGGEVQKHLMDGNYERAKEVALEYNDIFGDGNFFLEIQRHGLKEQNDINPLIIMLSKETGIPLVATNDCHYVEAEDWEAHDVLMAHQAGTTIYDKKRKVYTSHEFYIKSGDEMKNLFSDVPGAISNTELIANRCHVELEFGVNKLPPFRVPDSFEGNNVEYLTKLCYEGASELYKAITPDIAERIEYEIDIIDKMGYVNYFLITWDFFRFCKYGTEEIGGVMADDWEPILVGPGRGSAAGSVVAYTLGITKIEPLQYNLLFERFLDPSRIGMPDVDSDFEDRRRQEVIDYTIKKYGRKSVAQIITFGTLAARASIRTAGRCLDYAYATYDKVAKMIPQRPGITITAALDENMDLASLYENNLDVKKIIDIALRLEGLPTNTSTHAAGVLITDELGVEAHVPMWKNESGIVVQYDKDMLEALGLLKMDFLGLKTLGVLGEAKDFIYNNYGESIEFDEIYKLPTMEPLKLIKEGRTIGVFQLESPGMTSFMKELMPDNIEDIIAGISLYRPGPMKEIPRYLYNKRNPNTVSYPFPEVKEILGETYGVLTYQEQCMRAVVNIAGYDKSDSDTFRKVMAKKQEKYLPLHRKWFTEGRKKMDHDEYGKIIEYPHEIPGGITKGYSEDELLKFFDLMEDFAKYAFNKSHAAAYAFLAYGTAWFAYYYPTEFMAALLNSVRGVREKVSKYIDYCRRVLGIDITEPDVNLSIDRFIPLPDRTIVYGLSVKNTQANSLQDMIKERELNGSYEDMVDFIIRTRSFMNKATFKSLILCGAFNSFNITKSRWIAGLEDIWSVIKKSKDAEQRALKSGRDFNFRDNFVSRLDGILPEIDEYPKKIALRLEKEILGLYLTDNPLFEYSYSIRTISDFEISQIEYEIDEETGATVMLDETARDGRRVKFICMVSEITEMITKKKDQMAILQLEDLSGVGKAIVWPKDYQALKRVLNKDEIYLISGYLKVSSDDEPSIIIQNAENIEEIVVKRVIVDVDDKSIANDIIKHIKANSGVQGSTPLYIRYGGLKVLVEKEFWISIPSFEAYAKNNNISYEIQSW